MAQTAVDIVVKTLGADKLRVLDRQLQGIEPSARKASRAVDGVSKAVQGLGRVLATAAIGDQFRRSFGAAAEFSATQQRVQNLTKTYQQFIGIQNLAAQSAKRFGVSNAQALSDLTDLGSRLGGTGASLKDLENIYQGFNTLLVNNAVNAQQAAAATLQLNQALGSGRLAGEEFNAINEATPQLLDEVAKVIGVARGELKQLASDGEISSQVLLQALKNIKTQGADALADSLKTPAGRLRQFDAAIKDFQVSVGTELLPVITPLVQELTKLIRGFAELPGPIKTAGVAAGAAAVGFGALNIALGTLGVNLLALTGGGLSNLARLLAIVGGGAKTTAVGFTAAGAAITKTTVAISAATVALGALKIAIIALPLAALAAVLNENIQKKREFDEVMKSNSPDILTGKIVELTQTKKQLKSTLDAIEGGTWYKGMTSDINQIQGQIDELDEQIDNATRRRQLIVDIQVQGAIPNFDELSDAGIQEALSLAGVGGGTVVNPSPVTNVGGGGGGGGRESQVPALERELTLSRQLDEVYGRMAQAEIAGNEQLLIRLRGEEELFRLMKDMADIDASDSPENEKILERELNRLQVSKTLLDVRTQLALQAKAEAENIEQALAPLNDQTELLQAKLDGREEEVRLLQKARNIAKDIKGLETGDVLPILQRNEALKEQIEQAAELEDMYKGVATSIASEMTGAFKSIINGTKSVEEAFADMAKGIANKLLDMAMKILQDALIQQLMNLLKSLSGPAPSMNTGIPLNGFADGGRPPVSQVSLVGERGPELFVPDSAGTIIPNEVAFDDASNAMVAQADAFAAAGESLNETNVIRAANQTATAEQTAMKAADEYFQSDKSTISFDTFRVGEMDLVTREDAMKIGMESAKQAEANVYKGLRNMPAIRGRSGVKG